MVKNVGGFDRIARIAVGLVVIIAGIVFHSWWGIVGVIPLATGAMRSCPVYIPLGISTAENGADTKSGKP
jgi:hypothetical protein